MHILFIIIILLIFLVPTFNLGGIPVRLEDIVILFVFVYYLPFLIRIIFKQKHIPRFHYLLFMLFLTYTLSLLFAYFRGYEPIISDYNTVVSYIRYMIVLSSGLIIGWNISISLNRLLFFSIVGILFSSTLALVQFFDFGGLGTASYMLYGKEDRILYGVSRAIGVFGNPNYASFFHLIGLITLLIIRPNDNKLYRLLYLVLILLVFLSVIVTMSRTGIIVLFFIGIIYLFISGYVRSYKSVILFIIVFLIVAYFALNGLSIIERFRIEDIVTLNSRIDMIWHERIKEFHANPIIGNGPQKAALSNTMFSIRTYDNSFLYLLLTSGFVGLVLYGLLYANIVLFFKGIYLNSNRYLYAYILMLHMVIALFFITTDLVVQVHFTTFYFFIIGILISYSRKLEISYLSWMKNYHLSQFKF